MPQHVHSDSGRRGQRPGGDVAAGHEHSRRHALVQNGQDNAAAATTNNPAGAAEVTANNPSGAAVSAAVQTVYVYDTDALTDGGISITKTALNAFTGPGEVLNYQYVVKNTGNITLNGVSVTDEVTPADSPVSVMCPLSLTDNLAPGASETCTGTYTTTAGDVTNTQVTNDATASGNDVDFGNTYTDSDSVTLPLEP